MHYNNGVSDDVLSPKQPSTKNLSGAAQLRVKTPSSNDPAPEVPTTSFETFTQISSQLTETMRKSRSAGDEARCPSPTGVRTSS